VADLPDLTFFGAAGTVTGSKHRVRTGRHELLLDCGLFQGWKELRLRNWSPPAFDAARLAAVVLSHAHVDHSGYLPVLVRDGFAGPIFCTAGTADLLRVLLLDAAKLQEEEAAAANRFGYAKHRPALPLYTGEDAERALRLVSPCAYDAPFSVTDDASAIFRRAGHILGSATIELRLAETRLVFSGDLGRWNRPILRDPEPVTEADVVLIESTYGDRVHATDPVEQLVGIVHAAVARGGALLIPSFAVGRAQELVWTLRRLEDAQRIPSLPVFIDSPMAIDVTEIYSRHPEDHDLEMSLLVDGQRSPLRCRQQQFVRSAQESRTLNHRDGPMIVIAGSGMATGGRILHHLKRRLPDARTTVLLPGFQAADTRGRKLQEGAREVRIHGEAVPVRAKVETLDGLSAHADREEILRWLGGFADPPRVTYVVHGEPGAAASLADAIRTRLGWTVAVAADDAVVSLAGARVPGA
jgi:metallo-beta-lactamase family protein